MQKKILDFLGVFLTFGHGKTLLDRKITLLWGSKTLLDRIRRYKRTALKEACLYYISMVFPLIQSYSPLQHKCTEIILWKCKHKRLLKVALSQKILVGFLFLQNKYAKSLSWTENFNKLFTDLGGKFRFWSKNFFGPIMHCWLKFKTPPWV